MIPTQTIIYSSKQDRIVSGYGRKPLSADGPPKKNNSGLSADQEKLRNLATRSNQVLFRASAVFPFDFFPTQVVIDGIKVTIFEQYFFASGRVRSIEIKDIEAVHVETAPVFATLKIKTKIGPLIDISYLTKKDAFEAAHILQGLMIGESQHVEFANVQPDVLKERLEVIGSGKEESQP